MIKTFCDKCGVELNDENILSSEHNIEFPILDVKKENGCRINTSVYLNPVGAWQYFDICRKCTLEAMKNFIDEIDFNNEENFKNKK